MKHLHFFIFFTLLTISTIGIQAQENKWTGASDDQWNNASNWSLGTVPTNSDIVTFDNSPSSPVELSSTVNIGDLNILSGVVVTLTATNNITMNVQNLAVESTAEFNITGTSKISVSLQQQGTIDGKIMLDGAQHSVSTNSPNRITFKAGSLFIAESTFTGYPFGTTTQNENTVIFEDGATYKHIGGDTPFGIGGSISDIVSFEPESVYEIYNDGSLVEMAGKTFGHVKVYTSSPVTVNSNSTTAKTLSLTSLETFNDEFNFQGNEYDEIQLKGNLIAAIGGNINLTTGENGIILTQSTTTFDGPFEISLDIDAPTTSTYNFINNTQTLLLRAKLTTNAINQPVTIQCNGVLDCADFEINQTNTEFYFTAGSTLKTSHAYGLSGNIPNDIANDTGMNIEYFGTSSQDTGLGTIPNRTFNKITINNTDVVNLNTDITIQTELILTQGKFNIQGASLTLENSAGITTLDAQNNYIITDNVGLITHPLAASETFYFPIGSALYSSPAEITSQSAETYSINLKPEVYEDGSTGGTAVAENNIVRNTWYINTNGTSSFDLSLYWDSNLQDTDFDTNKAYITTYISGTGWDESAAEAVTNSGFAKTLSRTNLTQGAFSIKSVENTPPTGADKTIDWIKNTNYTFADTDFGFSDSDGGTFTEISIQSNITAGILFLDKVTNNGIYDAGEELTTGDIIPVSDINAGLMIFQPNTDETGSPYASFTFLVKDESDYSTTTNTITINITDSNTPPTSNDNTIYAVQDLTYIFSESDFPYNDADGQALSDISITTSPSGQLFIDDNADGLYDSSDDTSVAASDIISASDLSNGKFMYLPPAGANGTGADNFSFTVGDGIDYSSPSNTITVDIQANQLPTSANTNIKTAFETDFTFYDTNFSYSDPDSDPQAGILIMTLPSQGTLYADTNTNGITDAGEEIPAGELPVEIITSDLQNGILKYSPPAGVSGSYITSYDFKVTDQWGAESSTSYSVNISINTPPAAVSTTLLTKQNINIQFKIADFGYTDAENDPLYSLFASSLPPAGEGTLFLDTDADAVYTSGTDTDITTSTEIFADDITNGKFIYMPPANTSLTTSFDFIVSDGMNTGNSYTMTIQINEAPTGADGSVSIMKNTNFTFSTSDFNYSDAENDPMTEIQITTIPSTGTLYNDINNDYIADAGEIINTGDIISETNITAGYLKYSPPADAIGSPLSNFRFKVSDGSAYSASDYNLDLNVVNSPPESTSNSITTGYETVFVFDESDFTFSDADAEDLLTYVKIESLPANGILFIDADASGDYNTGEEISVSQDINITDLTAGNFMYQPNTGYSGNDNFNFDVSDGTDYSSGNYSMNITVEDATNNPPTSANNSVTTTYETIFVFDDTYFEFNDADAGDLLSNIEILTLPANGILFIDADASGDYNTGEEIAASQDVSFTDLSSYNFMYLPNAGYSGNDSFNFEVSDGTDYSSGNYTMNITIEDATNNPPTSANNSVTTSYETIFVFDDTYFEFIDTDTEDELTGIRITSLTPNGILFIDTDASGDLTSGEQVADNQEIDISDLSTGKFMYQPNAGYSGDDNFRFEVFDGTDYSSGNYTMTITVENQTNTPPTAASNTYSITANTDYIISYPNLNYTDADYDYLNEVLIQQTTTNGILFNDINLNSVIDAGETLTNNSIISGEDVQNGQFTYRPNTGLTGASADFFEFYVNDGTENSTDSYFITFDIYDNIPTASNSSITILPNETYTFNQADFHFSDDNPYNYFTYLKIISNVTNGTIYIDANYNDIAESGEEIIPNTDIDVNLINYGELKYTPNTDDSGNPYDNFTFAVSNGYAYSNETYNFDINVNGNQAPTADYQEFTVAADAQNGDYVGQIQATDPEGDTFSFIVNQGDTETFLISAEGDITVLDAKRLLNTNEFYYTIEVKDNGSPSASNYFDILIRVSRNLDLTFANYISPNNDGYNDYWIIRGDLSQLNNYDLNIFDSTGNQVFRSTGYDNSWDGTNNGQTLPSGVYYYIFKSPDNEIKGTITLGR